MSEAGPSPLPPRPAHVSEGDWRKHCERIAAIRRAGAAALPGPLREAFAGEPPRIHGLTLRPVNVGLIAILERIQSPFMEIIRQSAARQANGAAAAEPAPEIKAEPESGIETAFCFVKPNKELRNLLDQGRDVFRKAALDSIGEELHPAQLAELQLACGIHFAASFATVVEYKPDTPEGGGDFPSPAARTTTGSAGGSTSSEP